MSKLYIINITPHPWKRPGLSKKKFFDTQTQEKLALGIWLNQQHGELPFYMKPIELDMTFYMPIPKSSSAKATAGRAGPRYHFQRPDIDNLCKLILDAATGVLWEDDKVVSRLIAQKIYDKKPRIEFTITHLE